MPTRPPPKTRPATSTKDKPSRPPNNENDRQKATPSDSIGVWQGRSYRNVPGGAAHAGPIRQLWFQNAWCDLYNDSSGDAYWLSKDHDWHRCRTIGSKCLAMEVKGHMLYACDHDHYMNTIPQAVGLPAHLTDLVYRNDSSTYMDQPVPHPQIVYPVPRERSSRSSMWSIDSMITEPIARSVHGLRRRRPRYHPVDELRAPRNPLSAGDVIIQNVLPAMNDWPKRRESSADRYGTRFRSLSRRRRY